MRSLQIELQRVSYQFDDVVVDPAAFRLFKAGKAVHIEPKALQILILLLQRQGQLVTKQELLSEIWLGVAVTENALTRAIAQLRKTLGDDAEAPRYIETVPTRGYRFIAPVQIEEPAPRARPHRTRVVILSFVVAGVVLGVLA